MLYSLQVNQTIKKQVNMKKYRLKVYEADGDSCCSWEKDFSVKEEAAEAWKQVAARGCKAFMSEVTDVEKKYRLKVYEVDSDSWEKDFPTKEEAVEVWRQVSARGCKAFMSEVEVYE